MAVALAGMDPLRFLTTTDPLEVAVTQELASRIGEITAKRDQNRAIQTANAIWGALKKGRKS